MLARSNEIESFGETKQTFFLSLLISDIFNGRWASSTTSHRTRQQNINVIFVSSFSVLVSFWVPLFSAQPHSSHCNEQIFFFIFPLTDFFLSLSRCSSWSFYFVILFAFIRFVSFHLCSFFLLPFSAIHRNSSIRSSFSWLYHSRQFTANFPKDAYWAVSMHCFTFGMIWRVKR